MFNKIKQALVIIFIVLIVLVSTRVLILYLPMDHTTGIIKTWLDFTSLFIKPWEGIYPDIEKGKSILEISSLVAILFYATTGFIFQRSLRVVKYKKFQKVFASIVDTLFKLVELEFATRFLLKLSSASHNSIFVRIIYTLSNFIHRPSSEFLGDLKFEDFGGVIELSTLILLIIVFILDVIAQRSIRILFGEVEKNKPDE
ncbi:hypothetical protein GF362_04700 [Candidatus Dojkabacteria bacterium]|nr:hypothetical protein [Candidatus Dojkabacteria bacterium]